MKIPPELFSFVSIDSSGGLFVITTHVLSFVVIFRGRMCGARGGVRLINLLVDMRGLFDYQN